MEKQEKYKLKPNEGVSGASEVDTLSSRGS